jgi:hypothetical protein
MELLRRLGAVVGISLVLTLLLIVLYQDERAEAGTDTPQTSVASISGTP